MLNIFAFVVVLRGRGRSKYITDSTRTTSSQMNSEQNLVCITQNNKKMDTIWMDHPSSEHRLLQPGNIRTSPKGCLSCSDCIAMPCTEQPSMFAGKQSDRATPAGTAAAAETAKFVEKQGKSGPVKAGIEKSKGAKQGQSSKSDSTAAAPGPGQYYTTEFVICLVHWTWLLVND